MTTTWNKQQTEETLNQNADVRFAGQFKKTPAEVDAEMAAYFAEKAAKAAKREAGR
jgi:hypothetical protein